MNNKQPTVNLIDFTGNGAADPAAHAAALLVFTKSTRLNMKPDLFLEITKWPPEKIRDELEYMANTIPSSWEFIEYKFLLNNVTRAFTHQLVRTRTGSYAQQTMRVLDVGGWSYATGPSIEGNPLLEQSYNSRMSSIADTYDDLIESGAEIEDARGVLPTNIHTNIMVKFDLRTLADTMRKRASGRTQGEYRAVLDGMVKTVLAVHPWASLFFDRTFDKAAGELESAVLGLGDHIGKGEVTRLVKLIDQMRTTA